VPELEVHLEHVDHVDADETAERGVCAAPEDFLDLPQTSRSIRRS
jgi:hypothetical protein